ncbi:MAG: MMPL family transporter [Thermomicrobiales bacterium]
MTEHDLIRSEVFGLPAALLVLILVFGALVAAGIPIVLSIVSIAGAVGLTLLLGRVTSMSVYALNMISMIGLAVGVDYALFIVDRFREERRMGHAPAEAMARTAATSGRAVLFSGATVAISLLGMLLLPTTLFRSLGAGAILVVVVALLATLTLLPAPGDLGEQARLAASSAMAWSAHKGDALGPARPFGAATAGDQRLGCHCSSLPACLASSVDGTRGCRNRIDATWRSTRWIRNFGSRLRCRPDRSGRNCGCRIE